MSGTWSPEDQGPRLQISLAGWLRVVLRGVVVLAVVLGGLVLLLAVRLIERPICGLNRPVTPYITQAVCKAALAIVGVRLTVIGTHMRHNGAVVANHVSWLDIFTLNAAKRIYFVAKSEVAGWPLIGWLARATGTVFIARRQLDAKIHLDIFADRLNSGHKLLFFPEGTSTDGLQVLPFKSTLFQAFFAQNLRDTVHIQPVTVKYTAPAGEEARFFGWWGDMALAPHLLKTLAGAKSGSVKVIYHTPVAVANFKDRKALALYCETVVRAGLVSGAQLSEESLPALMA
ncbi:acyl-phosphate glycerol 3-phosphate acyltransferase [Marinosulfonomonas sp. PRT-SC04]|nr:acyl-phosphate glycerol 3-phosphate acyltransferase [Marinosulfonomonas sp. PRT-SC04]